MAVFLKVATSGYSTTTGQTLAGQECLVFYLGGTPNAAPKHPGGINVLLCDGSVRYAKDVDEIMATLKTEAGAGTTIIIGLANQTGFYSTRLELAPGSKQVPTLGLTGGGQVVMIGLLLPAVQAAREAARRKTPTATLQQLKSLVGPGGHVFVIDSNAALLPA